MNTQITSIAKTGDVIALSSNIFVRVLTGHTESHVGILVWFGKRLFVAEFIETKGFNFVLLEEWLKGVEECTVGTAPPIVNDNYSIVINKVIEYNNKGKIVYGWLTLPLVWFSQLTGIKFPHIMEVCSTFVQKIWEEAGYTQFTKVADPGDIINACMTIRRFKND